MRSTSALRSWKRAILAVLAAAAVAMTSCDGSGSPPASSASSASGATSALAEPSDTSVFHYVNLRTGATSPLPPNVARTWSLISPDGRMFLYVGPNDGLFVANIDGSGERQVTPAGIAASLGGWSPDGSVVVYQADNVGRKVGNVFTVELATGEVTQLTDLEQERSWTWVTDMEPAFGPDGTTVVFHRPRPTDRAWDIWSIPVTGGEPTIVRRNAGWGRYSPDGASLAYLTEFSDSDLSGVIMIADVAAGPGRRLAAVPFRAGPPIWSPDGTRVAYLGSGVRVVDLATGETSLVASCGGPVEWFDDDTLIVGPGGC